MHYAAGFTLTAKDGGYAAAYPLLGITTAVFPTQEEALDEAEVWALLKLRMLANIARRDAGVDA